MQDLPIIFLIQGSFQTSVVYEQLVKRLHTLGFVTVQPRLPSGSNTESPDFSKTTLVDDALAMRLELVRQIEYGGKTVLVAMHSYGGLVGSEAIPEELSHSKYLNDGITGLGEVQGRALSCYLQKPMVPSLSRKEMTEGWLFLPSIIAHYHTFIPLAML